MAVPVITPIKGTYQRTKDGVAATRKFSILASSEADAEAVLLAQEGIELYSVLETAYGETPDPDCVCQSIDIEAQKPALVGGGGGDGLYLVTCRFARSVVDGSFTPAPPELDGAARFQIERATVSAPVDHDIDGKPITNSADEEFSPPLNKLTVNRVLVADWIRKAASQTAAETEYEEYEGKLNSTTWRGAARGTIFCHAIEPTEIEPGVYRYVGRFERRPPQSYFGNDYEGWEDVLIDQGYRTKGDPDMDGKPTYTIIKDKEGNDPTKPVRLDGTGQVLADGADPVVLSFKHYEYIDFNGIDI